MRRTAGIASTVAALVAFGGALPTAHAGLLGRHKAPAPPRSASGVFANGCTLSHRLSDDPIVVPGSYGASHLHDFFGNESTDAASTRETLLANGATSCTLSDDLSAYWAPTLYVGSRRFAPQASAYYLVGGRNPAFIRSFPAGLKMIAGNSRAMQRQSTRVIEWSCPGSRRRQNRDAPPLCPHRSLMLIVRFPDCWDGVNLDSADHKSHMAYSKRLPNGMKTCMGAHSVPVPLLELHLRYKTRGGPLVRLSSGPARTAHADFFNAWHQSVLDGLVQRCLNGNADCRDKK
jgi:hypothetical protein